jgi:hypothetical protein
MAGELGELRAVALQTVRLFPKEKEKKETKEKKELHVVCSSP